MVIDLSVVLPCFNEEYNIEFIYKEIKDSKPNNLIVEVIFVNNGSIDATEQKIDKISNENSIIENNSLIITKLNLSKNEGYGGAIIYGLQKAQGKYIGWTHADLQTPIEDCFKLFNLINGKKNIFGSGYRTNNRGFDSVVTRLHELCASKILGFKMAEINAQPKIIEREKLVLFKNPPKKWTALDTYFYYMSLKNNLEIVRINVTFKSRIYGQSKWKSNFFTFIKHIFFNFLYLIRLKLEN